MSKVVISKKNEVFLKIQSEPHVYQELSDHFSFDIEGAQYMKQYRKRYWDGKIRLFSTHTRELYVGLLDKLVSFCQRHGYDYEFIDSKFFKYHEGMIEQYGLKSREGQTSADFIFTEMNTINNSFITKGIIEYTNKYMGEKGFSDRIKAKDNLKKDYYEKLKQQMNDLNLGFF